MFGATARRALTAAAVALAIMTIGLATSFVMRARGVDAGARAATIGEVVSRAETAETLAAQAIVFALDAATDVIEESSAVTARVRLEDGLAVLRRTGAPASLADDHAAVIETGERLVSELRLGEVDLARNRFTDELVPRRAELTESASEELASLSSWSADNARMAELVLWASSAASMAVVGVAVAGGLVAAFRNRGRHEDVTASSTEPHIVITLPDGPNELSMRRRRPKVEDLGWLLDQILVPFADRGWEVDVSCPNVGVDSDPSDLRDMVVSMLARAESAGAERIGIVVKASSKRVKIVVVDDGPSVFGADGNAIGAGPVQLRSAVRTRAEAAGASLSWSRTGDLNVGVLDVPRLDRLDVGVPV